jgi:hypothetical protein
MIGTTWAYVQTIPDTIPWSTPGGDFSPTVISSFDSTSGGNQNGFYELEEFVTFPTSPAFVATVQSAVDDARPLQLIMRAAEQEALGTRAFLRFSGTTPTSPIEARPLLSIEYTTGAGTPGDFNSDGSVDAADYTVWRDNLGSATPLPNDNELGTPVGEAHYTLWKNTFSSGSGAGATSLAVPEPSTLVIFTVILIGAAWQRR